MVRRGRCKNAIVALVASIVLAIGLVPAQALALTISPAGSSLDAKAAPEGCIAFTSDAPFEVSLGPDKHWDGTIEYSLDGGTWSEYTAGTSINSDDGCAVFFRGTGNTRLGEVDGVYRHSTFSLSPSDGHTVSCLGNAETLLDYQTVLGGGHPTMAGLAFYRLFFGCTPLDSAPELPATGLAESCYRAMFFGCTSLAAAPELPAEGLAESCYSEMFYGCTSLTAAPELPATALADRCYQDMFFGCTSLTSAPELPATELAGGCYDRMFYGCTALLSAPELPATELAASCYRAMFCGCTALVSAPELPATKLFTVNSSGTVTSATGCYQGMFQGCTSLTEAPALPAKEMVNNCYDRMFRDCTALTTPPALPAEELDDSCYRRMFENSGVRLSEEPGIFDGVFYGIPYRIPSEGAGTDAPSALDNMFSGTAGKFTGTPAINKTYYLGIPSVDVPAGKSLVYTGAEQTGVEPGEGYTLTGEKASDAGDHTATATLLDGYAWSDGTMDARDVPWSIAPKPVTITVDGASKVEGEEDPAFTGTVEGLVAEGDLGEVRYVRTNNNEESGTYEGVLTAEYTANPNYEVTVVPGDFTIKAVLTFDLAGGTLDGKTGSITIEANVGDTVKLPAAPTREGYTFKYWKGSQYAAGADYVVPEGGHAFTAEWEKDASSGSGNSDKKSPLPSTGDDDAAALTLCALMALASLALLSGSVVLRRRGSAYKGKHSAR